MKGINYTNRCTRLGLISLEKSRLLKDIELYYKILNRLIPGHPEDGQGPGGLEFCSRVQYPGHSFIS